MKRLLLLGVGSALMFTMGGVGPAQADGGKHISTAQGAGITGGLVNNAGGRCAGCHRAHTAKAEYLLKVAQPQLCYSCHQSGAGAITDVSRGLVNGTSAALRGGGFDKALIGSALATKDTGVADAVTGKFTTSNQTVPVLGAGVTTTSKHLIDGVSAGTAWGNGTDASGAGKSLTLECGSCHDPHGNGNFRVLRAIPVDSGFKSRLVHAATPYKPAVEAVPAVIGKLDDPTTDINEYVEAVPEVKAAAEVLATSNVYSDAKGVNIPDEPGLAREYTTANYWLSGKSNVPLSQTRNILTGLPSTTIAAATLTGTSKSTDVATDGTVSTLQKTDGYISNIANWCTTCHTRYLAESGSYKKARPSATAGQVDGNFTYQHRSDANYKGSAANCITCHVSHGSNATMDGPALTVANPGAALTAGGDATTSSADSKLLRIDNRGTCNMCHNV